MYLYKCLLVAFHPVLSITSRKSQELKNQDVSLGNK